MSEAALYERMWTHADYRHVAPGEQLAYRFVELAKPYGRVIDFGAGTGRGAALIHALANVPVMAVDFAENCLDDDVRKIEAIGFRKHDLREPLGDVGEFGFCTDVMEHIAPDDVESVLMNVLTAAKRVFFAISTVPDHFGPVLAGEPLHLTVKPHAWWKETLEKLGARIDWEEDRGEAALFYASIYANGDDYCSIVGLNVPEQQIKDNIRANLRLGLQEVSPHLPQPDVHICLLAGGPSLADHEDEIIERGKAGELFVTVNGTYKWLIDRGIKPAAQFMVDAREFNARFVEPVIDTCKYIMSSQTSPNAIAKLPRDQVWLYHSNDGPLLKECLEEHCKETGKDREWYPVAGGSTVICRALVCLAMLGFRNVEVFGWDSCLRGEDHHAYKQPENDSAHTVSISVGGKAFRCHPWMVVQANEVPKLIRYVLGPIEDFNLQVRGDGLIAHMIQHAASLASKGN